MKHFALKGNILFTPQTHELHAIPNSYVICHQDTCKGVYPVLPDEFRNIHVIDYGDALIIPGMVDLHVHAPQYAFRGTGTDCELMDWLKTYAFQEEAKYSDIDYAARAYAMFAAQMTKGATTRAAIFGTIHTEAALLLMDLMEGTGIVSFVGKVNIDREAPPELRESSAEESASDTVAFINAAPERGCTLTKPILTPRFIPSCSNELLDALAKIRRTYCLPVQSHLSENPEEVELVRKLMPEAEFYGDAYDRYGMFGRNAPTIMAHCVYSSEAEAERIRANGVWVAHCPNSNMNLASGIAPIRKYLDAGIRVGLGSDVAGGQTESIFRAVTDAVQVSKLYWRCVDSSAKPLSFTESFYLATKGGG